MPSRQGRCADLPSLLFLLSLATTTACMAASSNVAIHALLLLPQALLLLGCQEAKHLGIHGRFLSNRRANDAVGTVCAALFGMNFEANRHFHLRHHRAPCTEQDPEGMLYAMSWRTRAIWLMAPLELLWVAYHIQRLAWRMVPPGRRRWLAAGAAVQLAVAASMAVLAWRFPWAVLWAYALPLALACWIDFPLTQGEHYGAPVLPASQRRDPGEISIDIVLPAGLGWLTLHRSLHRVHHRQPGRPWVEAPQALREGPTPMSYFAFVRHWWAAGPRLWPDAIPVSPGAGA